jgi:hypothetical protein
MGKNSLCLELWGGVLIFMPERVKGGSNMNKRSKKNGSKKGAGGHKDILLFRPMAY